MADEELTPGTPGTEADGQESVQQAMPAAEKAGDSGGEQSAGSLLSDDAAADAQPSDAPEKYELTPPEGMDIQPAQMEAFQVQARQLGLTQEQTQTLLEIAHANQQAQLQAHAEQVRNWKEQVRADKDMGGDNFQATAMYAKAGLKAFDAEGKVFAMLEKTGYSNHPDVIRFLSRIGKPHAEDKALNGQDASGEIPLEERLYPHWKP